MSIHIEQMQEYLRLHPLREQAPSGQASNKQRSSSEMPLPGPGDKLDVPAYCQQHTALKSTTLSTARAERQNTFLLIVFLIRHTLARMRPSSNTQTAVWATNAFTAPAQAMAGKRPERRFPGTLRCLVAKAKEAPKQRHRSRRKRKSHWLTTASTMKQNACGKR